MAAVTTNSKKYNVVGDMKQQLYNINIATTGDTLTVGLINVNAVNCTPKTGGVTDVAVAAGTILGTSVITFTSGAVNNQLVEVLGT